MDVEAHAFAFPFNTKIDVNPGSPLEEVPLQEMSNHTSQNFDPAKHDPKKDEEDRALKTSAYSGFPEQNNKVETENKLPAIQEKEEKKPMSAPKSSVFTDERSPIHLNVEALKPQKEQKRVTLSEEDLLDENASHLLLYYH